MQVVEEVDLDLTQVLAGGGAGGGGAGGASPGGSGNQVVEQLIQVVVEVAGAGQAGPASAGPGGSGIVILRGPSTTTICSNHHGTNSTGAQSRWR